MDNGLDSNDVARLLKEAEHRMSYTQQSQLLSTVQRPNIPIQLPNKLVSYQSRSEKLRDHLVPLRPMTRAKTVPKPEERLGAGPSWFDLPQTTEDTELKQFWQLLRMRGILDPKNRKKAVQSQLPKYGQLGQILDGSETSVTRGTGERLIQDLTTEEYISGRFKSRYGALQRQSASGGKLFHRSKVSKRRGRS